MKRFVSILLALAMLLSVLTVASFGEGTVEALSGGSSNISFSNGYVGFCIDADERWVSVGESFTTTFTSVATNNISNEGVSQKLKVLFTQFFDELFVPDGDGGYVVDDYLADGALQAAIWNITDDDYIWGTSKDLVNRVNAYTGPAIPDSGYQLTLDNGDVVTFHFIVLEPTRVPEAGTKPTQSFFAYRLEVSRGGTTEPEHTHTEVIDEGKNPTCEEPGLTPGSHCGECGEPIVPQEEIPATGHTASGDWKKDENGHWHECTCNEVMDEGEHRIDNEVCTVCGWTQPRTPTDDPDGEDDPTTGDDSDGEDDPTTGDDSDGEDDPTTGDASDGED
ncbi:MAG: Cys-Gln thioester bond-forming surface protein, partial [Clostridia bacterium]|nr:Cys-Gln thioester bond-forming surface protein [Clostridia bacterium]